MLKRYISACHIESLWIIIYKRITEHSMHLNDWTTPICISAKSKIPDLHKSGMNDAEYIQQEVLCS